MQILFYQFDYNKIISGSIVIRNLHIKSNNLNKTFSNTNRMERTNEDRKIIIHLIIKILQNKTDNDFRKFCND